MFDPTGPISTSTDLVNYSRNRRESLIVEPSLSPTISPTTPPVYPNVARNDSMVEILEHKIRDAPEHTNRTYVVKKCMNTVSGLRQTETDEPDTTNKFTISGLDGTNMHDPNDKVLIVNRNRYCETITQSPSEYPLIDRIAKTCEKFVDYIKFDLPEMSRSQVRQQHIEWMEGLTHSVNRMKLPTLMRILYKIICFILWLISAIIATGCEMFFTFQYYAQTTAIVNDIAVIEEGRQQTITPPEMTIEELILHPPNRDKTKQEIIISGITMRVDVKDERPFAVTRFHTSTGNLKDGVNADLLIDSGAALNLIPEWIINDLYKITTDSDKPEVLPTNSGVVCHNGSSLPIIGKTSLYINILISADEQEDYTTRVVNKPNNDVQKDKSILTNFFITSCNVDPVVGRKFMGEHGIDLLNRGDDSYIHINDDEEGEINITHPRTKDQPEGFPVWLSSNVEMKTGAVSSFSAKLSTWPHTSTPIDDSEALLRLEYNQTDDQSGENNRVSSIALTRFERGATKMAIYNPDNNGMIIGKCEIGMAYPIPEGAFKYARSLKHLVSSMSQCHTNFHFSTSCVCQVKPSENPPVRVFFLTSDMTTVFPNIRVPDAITTVKNKYDNMYYDKDTNTLYCGPYLETIDDDQITESMAELKNKRLICNIMYEADLGFEEMDFLTRTSFQAGKIEIRIHSYLNKFYTCSEHTPFPRATNDEIALIFMAGNPPMGIFGMYRHSCTIGDILVDVFEHEGKNTLIIHLRQNEVLDKELLKEKTKSIMDHIKKAQYRRPFKLSVGITGKIPALEENVEALHPCSHGKVKIVAFRSPPIEQTEGSGFMPTSSCPCLTCTTKREETMTVDVGKRLMNADNTNDNVLKLSHMDFIDNDMMSVNSEIFPRNEDEFSVVGSELDEITFNEPICNTETGPEHGEHADDNMAENYDYSSLPTREKSFVKFAINSFAHVFTQNKNQRNFIRDTRIRMRLLLDRKPKRGDYYRGNPFSATIIDNLLTQEVLDERARFVHQPVHTNPTFLRLRNSKEIELMRVAMQNNDLNYQPNVRLIADYRNLNAAICKSHAYLPNIKDMLNQIGFFHYQSTFDLKSMFPSIAIDPRDVHLTTLQSPTNTCVEFLYITEGLMMAPDYASKVLNDSFFFSNPSAHELRQDKLNFEAEQRAGIKRKITNLDELAEALKEEAIDELPASHSKKYVGPGDITEDMRNRDTQGAMEKIFKTKRCAKIIQRKDINPDMLPTICCARSYMDDIHIGTQTDETDPLDPVKAHRMAIIALLIDMSNAHWLISLKKCNFFGIYGDDEDRSIEFVGYVIRPGGGYRPLKERIDSITRLMEPNNLKALQSVLGTTNFLSSHCPGQLFHAEKLYGAIPRARKEGSKFKLTEDERHSFEQLKEICSNPIELHIPEPTEPLFIECDSSTTVAAFICWANAKDGTRKIVGYHAKLYSQNMRANNSAIIKEMQAMLMALYHYRYLVFTHKTYLVTDSQALCSLWASSKISPNHKLELMMSKVSQYPIELLIHIPDKYSRADVLTRLCKNRTKIPCFQMPCLKTIKKESIITPLNVGQAYSIAEFDKIIGADPKGIFDFLKENTSTGQELPLSPIVDENSPHERREKKFLSALSKESFKLTKVITDDEKDRVMRFDIEEEDLIAQTPTPHFQTNDGETTIRIGHVSALYKPWQSLTIESIQAEHAKDPAIRTKIRTILTSKQLPKDLKGYSTKHSTVLLRRKQNKDGTWGEKKIVASDSMIWRLAAEIHSQNHQSGEKSARVLSRYFSAKNIRQICTTVGKTCKQCAMVKPCKVYDSKFGRMRPASRVLTQVSMDHIILHKPFYVQSRKMTAILTVTDEFSSFVTPRFVTAVSTEEIIRVTLEFMTYYNPTKLQLRTDNGSGFTSEKFATFCKEHGITLVHGIPYNSQSNAKVEKANDTVRQLFQIIYNTTLVTHGVALMLVAQAMNSIPRGIARGTHYTPHEVLFGRPPNDFEELLKGHITTETKRKQMIQNIEKVLNLLYKKEQANYLKALAKFPRRKMITVGSHCLLKDNNKPNKQSPRYKDTIYKVTWREGNTLNIEEKEDPSVKKRVSVRQVKPYNLTDDEIYRNLTDNHIENLVQQRNPNKKSSRLGKLWTTWSSIPSTESSQSSITDIKVNTADETDFSSKKHEKQQLKTTTNERNDINTPTTDGEEASSIDDNEDTESIMSYDTEHSYNDEHRKLLEEMKYLYCTETRSDNESEIDEEEEQNLNTPDEPEPEQTTSANYMHDNIHRIIKQHDEEEQTHKPRKDKQNTQTKLYTNTKENDQNDTTPKDEQEDEENQPENSETDKEYIKHHNDHDDNIKEPKTDDADDIAIVNEPEKSDGSTTSIHDEIIKEHSITSGTDTNKPANGNNSARNTINTHFQSLKSAFDRHTKRLANPKDPMTNCALRHINRLKLPRIPKVVHKQSIGQKILTVGRTLKRLQPRNVPSLTFERPRREGNVIDYRTFHKTGHRTYK